MAMGILEKEGRLEEKRKRWRWAGSEGEKIGEGHISFYSMT